MQFLSFPWENLIYVFLRRELGFQKGKLKFSCRKSRFSAGVLSFSWRRVIHAWAFPKKTDAFTFEFLGILRNSWRILMHSWRILEADNRPSGADNRSNAEQAKHLQSSIHVFPLQLFLQPHVGGLKLWGDLDRLKVVLQMPIWTLPHDPGLSSNVGLKSWLQNEPCQTSPVFGFCKT